MARVFKQWRNESKGNWGSTIEENTNIDSDKVQIGCLQRIADATEAMAKNHTQLINEAEMYKRWYNEGVASRNKLYKQISSYKGVITKQKKLIAQLKFNNPQ